MPVSIAPTSLDELLTTAGAANAVGVSATTIRQWRHRGHLHPQGLTEHGRPMYRWIDVVRAERATRDRARRTFAA